MSTFCELRGHGMYRRLRPALLLMLLGVALAGCGGGGGGSDSPAPPAPPAPPPPPPPAPTIPPLSTTVISLDDHHQVGVTRWANGDTSTGGQGQPVGGLECNATSPVGYHVHAHLSIFLNGEALTVPERIGFVSLSPTSDCHYQLHTHDLDGLLHVHATAPTAFTLGQMFSIWGQPLSSTDVAGLTGMPVRAFITDDGVVTEHTGDLSTIEMTSHREITIQIGTAITEIPNFTWTGE